MTANEIWQHFGSKIKENSHLLAQRLFENETYDKKHLDMENQSFIQENFFKCLGDSLYQGESMALEQLSLWAITSHLKYIQENKDSRPISFPSYIYNDVLFDFIEEAFQDHSIPPFQLMKLIKQINFYVGFSAAYFTNDSIQTFIQELSEDERITIHELNELKNALKEATILSITDQNDRIAYANDKFCRITKYSIEELVGKTHHELFHSGYHDDQFFEDTMKDIKAGKMWRGDICNKAKDGSIYWVDTTMVPFLNNKGETYQHISIMHDITEKKRTEDMLHKTEKLSLVGELAAGFAHEIRNPLTTIRGFVQILDKFTEEKKFLYSKTILDEIDRINFIVSEFMVFAKPHAIHFSECNLSNILRHVTHLLQAETALNNVDVTHSFAQDDVYIYGEKNQLTQVFLNIVKNAIDALPNGGHIKLSNVIRNNEVTISIEDNGIGMTKEQVNKIGEPFYTTKDKGTGLGLMVSYKIIENHRGRINVMSKLNKGTTFLITFPLTGDRHSLAY